MAMEGHPEDIGISTTNPADIGDGMSALEENPTEVKGNRGQFMKNKFLVSSDDDSQPQKGHKIRGKLKTKRTEAMIDKIKPAVICKAKPEKPKKFSLPWKLDFPDIQASPNQRKAKRKDTKDFKNAAESKAASPKEADEKLQELDTQISWIYEESSESDGSEEQTNTKTEGRKEGPFDVKFRDHLVKELLKQGKDINWYTEGVEKAMANLEKGQHANVPGLKSAARVSQQLNQFLKTSMRPYYQDKRKKPERKHLQGSQKQRIP